MGAAKDSLVSDTVAECNIRLMAVFISHLVSCVGSEWFSKHWDQQIIAVDNNMALNCLSLFTSTSNYAAANEDFNVVKV